MKKKLRKYLFIDVPHRDHYGSATE